MCLTVFIHELMFTHIFGYKDPAKGSWYHHIHDLDLYGVPAWTAVDLVEMQRQAEFCWKILGNCAIWIDPSISIVYIRCGSNAIAACFLLFIHMCTYVVQAVSFTLYMFMFCKKPISRSVAGQIQKSTQTETFLKRCHFRMQTLPSIVFASERRPLQVLNT